MTLVYVALGANLADPITQLDNACNALSLLTESDVQVSSYYRSRPMGEVVQPDFINAVACFNTSLSAIALLDALQHIENSQDRVRLERWGPRTLDLDIILYGNEQFATPRLTIPHIGMTLRSFVLIPLFELAPELILPNGSPLSGYVTQALQDELSVIETSVA
ncbi:2-amino-4-hydroxy-6-hydroxymethyldihydropteridine diphosphokinase [Shewanella surugensis]|uniref:2-amino-4-hydroxy-6-hydroxymethyldihydropteridine pyrophosphokinase n=1 Tax=Shewanella surugensis TaxID=212020 RepID=A0ABT0L5M9_9GAMM|nr:2-amino-4-hydroxy-6-hydroxymethyldihydropteridine diphosphokinase [Shewanella surugensis]MCL1122992.1 2-amino-4-hydroxy-6-hydroxymethyldihydropteridine diphosphokinase [Shewanella surugensis]